MSSRPLSDAFRGESNALGLLRLVLALAVVVAHAWPLGFGFRAPGHSFSHGQYDLGLLAVYGFFGLSGFLVTGSALRLPLVRFLTHRALRIFPGYWASVSVVGLLFAPTVWWSTGRPLQDLFSRSDGPVPYLSHNVGLTVVQPGIADIFASTPGGELVGASIVNGSLWSLQYEGLCYLLVAALCLAGVRSHAQRLVVLCLTGLWLLLVADAAAFGRHVAPRVWELHLGPVGIHILTYLAYAFMLGAAAHVLQDRIQLRGLTAAGAGALVLLTSVLGGFFLVGLPAFLYVLLWTASRLPLVTHRVGRRNDYSYGIYVYAWPVQMSLAAAGGAVLGLPGFIVVSIVATLVLAVPSWRFIESRALELRTRPAATRDRHESALRPVKGPSARSAAPLAAQPAPKEHGPPSRRGAVGSDVT